nr:hypothetical protein Itr_chr04CG24600 [Ipomoea trifida]
MAEEILGLNGAPPMKLVGDSKPPWKLYIGSRNGNCGGCWSRHGSIMPPPGDRSEATPPPPPRRLSPPPPRRLSAAGEIPAA